MTRKGFQGRSISDKTVERLFRYKSVLLTSHAAGRKYIYSHEIAREMDGTAAQVRRDLMEIDLHGTPQRGYDISGLLTHIDQLLSPEAGRRHAVLVGVGNLGSALLAYFEQRGSKVEIVDAFDVDPDKAGTTIMGYHVHCMTDLPAVIKDKDITIGIIAVPAAQAQVVCDELIRSGIRGIVNFAPSNLRIPEDVFTEHVDITLALEKTAFYANSANSIF